MRNSISTMLIVGVVLFGCKSTKPVNNCHYEILKVTGDSLWKCNGRTWIAHRNVIKINKP